jgi:hypothetical protein
MSDTTTPSMTIKAARALLNYTLGRDPQLIRQAEELIRALHSRKPGILSGGGMTVQTCQACGNSTWSLHTTDKDDERWACDRCHREPMSQEEGRVLKAARRDQADRLAAAKAQEEAAAPKPREVLAAVAAQLIEAKAEHARLEAASDAARDRLGDARLNLDGAEEALSIARNRLAETAVERCFDTAAVRKPSRGIAAEMAAVEAARSGLELATTASDTIADMLSDVGYQVRRLEKRHREAALAVLANEYGPLFVARATEARTEFIMASKGLQWLETAGTPLSSLIASELKWSWHNLPQSWTTGSQPGLDLDAALAELLADPHASVASGGATEPGLI